MMRSLTKLLLISCAAILLTSCGSINRAFHASSDNVDQAKSHLDQTKLNADAQEPPVIVYPGYYVDTTPINIADHPTWLDRYISLQGRDVSMSLMVNQILRKTGCVVSYQSGVQTNTPITLDYSGSIQGALDSISNKTNYAYNIDGKQISWTDMLTKTFDISFMPGTSDYLVGQSAGATNLNSSDTDISTIKGNLDDEQFSNMKGNLSVWQDLKNTINNLKSKDGNVFVSEATTTVTVNDHPANVRAISEFIKQLNQTMSRQVQLKVQVLQVQLNESHQYGVDWNILQQWLGTKFSIQGNIAQTVNTAAAGEAASPISFVLGDNRTSDTSFLMLKAIGQQGKVSVLTEPSVTTLNNQVAEVRISTDTSYLKKLEQSTYVNGPTSTSLEPGVVTDGFTLYLLPKIQDHKIFLQISSTMSTLDKIDTISSNGATNSQDNKEGTTIQIPTLSEKRFNIRSVVNNGNTLIIGGFRQINDEAKSTQMFGSTALGGRGSSHGNSETIVLITPTIIENNS